jgi:monooxygenase
VLRHNYPLDLLSTRFGDVNRDMVFTARAPLHPQAAEDAVRR